MKPILDEYVKAMKAKGLPAAEALKLSAQDYLKAQLHKQRSSPRFPPSPNRFGGRGNVVEEE